MLGNSIIRFLHILRIHFTVLIVPEANVLKEFYSGEVPTGKEENDFSF